MHIVAIYLQFRELLSEFSKNPDPLLFLHVVTILIWGENSIKIPLVSKMYRTLPS